MSTPAGAVRYIIAADDRTKAAIASAQAGFRSMERGVKSSVRGINTALSVLAGVGLKRAFQSIFTETAKNSKEFAGALDEVRSAARDLLSSKDGAPAATAAMQELAETLKDPSVVAAADSLTSTLIMGFAKAVELIAQMTVGIQVIFGATSDEVENLHHRIEQVDALLANRRASIPGAAGRFADQLRAEIAALEAERDALIRQQSAAIDRGPSSQGRTFGFDTSLPGGLPGFEVGEIELDAEISRALKEFQRLQNINPIDHLHEQLEEFVDSLKTGIKDGISETAARAADDIDGLANRMEAAADKTRELSLFAEQAARNMQDQFANFLFDPFDDGIKGMLSGFINVIRRMVAEAAAAKIFETLGGASGIGGFLGSLFGSSSSSSITGSFSGPRATGGPVSAGRLYSVNENEIEFFRPNVGGEVIPLSKMRGSGSSGGGMNVTIVNQIDARGASVDAIRALPEVLRRNNDYLETRIIERLKSGHYGAGRA